MTRNNGKDSFYRTLNLDRDTKKLISWLQKTSKELKDNKVEDNDVDS